MPAAADGGRLVLCPLNKVLQLCMCESECAFVSWTSDVCRRCSYVCHHFLSPVVNSTKNSVQCCFWLFSVCLQCVIACALVLFFFCKCSHPLFLFVPRGIVSKNLTVDLLLHFEQAWPFPPHPGLFCAFKDVTIVHV